MLMAGATTVGVGSAIYYRGPDAITAIHAELAAWLDGHGRTLADITGAAHRECRYATAPSGAPVPAAH